MAATYFDFDYYVSIVAVTGAGDDLSEGVGAVGAPTFFDFDYVSLIIPVTGVGDNVSAGVGVVSTAAYFPFDYWDGSLVGAGDNSSQGVGAVTVVGPAAWYTIEGDVGASSAGVGDTLSQGVGSVSVYDGIVSVTGAGDTLSEGVGAVTTVVPPGGIRLSPYWAPGDLVYCYLLHEWLGSYEARLGAGAGPLVQIAYGDPDTTVAFGGLEPGQYVAVQGRKRVHFMVTP